MEGSERIGRSLERFGNSHLSTHCHTGNGFLHSCFSSSSGLFFSYSLRHALSNHLLKHLLIHTRIHGLTHSSLHSIRNGITNRTCDGVAKIHGSIGTEPLVGTIKSCGMLPTAFIMRTEHELLREGVHFLALFQLQIVWRHVVLIHQHAVLQELIAGGRSKEHVLHVVADGETSIQHVTLIAVHNGSCGVVDIKAIGLYRTFGHRLKLAIAKTILVHPLVINGQIEF